ncbi:MAG TPA: nucleic acid-binding protein, partial [Polyangiaceae bacterium]
LDSEGRPLATTHTPKLALGEVAFLEVTACTEFGAFADFGLPKELLIPFPEHTTKLFPGAWHPIGLYRDASGRLAGTMRVSKLLDQSDPGYTRDQWVMGETWRNDPDIGLFVILEKRYVGLVPAGEPHTLGRGESARFRVTALLPDGKIELSLRGHAHEELGNDAERILAAIARMPGGTFSERAGPEEIRTEFGVSRKAFKRAVGRLLREGKVTIDGEGVIALAGNDALRKH